jgi:hypothetical protein
MFGIESYLLESQVKKKGKIIDSHGNIIAENL